MEGKAMSDGHSYESAVTWRSERRGEASAADRATIAVGAPPEFQGTADVWSPEHLTVAAVNTCMMLTFITIAANSKLPFEAYTAVASGTLEKVDGRGMVFTKIVVRPRITLAAAADRAKAERVLRMTERNCFISNSLHAEVTLEAELVG
jgi:organic hydroperoxide reductase OsmC/OhrA